MYRWCVSASSGASYTYASVSCDPLVYFLGCRSSYWYVFLRNTVPESFISSFQFTYFRSLFRLSQQADSLRKFKLLKFAVVCRTGLRSLCYVLPVMFVVRIWMSSSLLVITTSSTRMLSLLVGILMIWVKHTSSARCSSASAWTRLSSAPPWILSESLFMSTIVGRGGDKLSKMAFILVSG